MRSPAKVVLLVSAIAGLVVLVLGLMKTLPSLAVFIGFAVLFISMFVYLKIAESELKKKLAAYASERGLSYDSDQSSIAPLTQLLRAGDSRSVLGTISGQLPGGLNGSLALYTVTYRDRDRYVEVDGDSSDVQTKEYTIVCSSLGDVRTGIRQISCQRSTGIGLLDDIVTHAQGLREVNTESIKLDKRYQLAIGKDDDPADLLQIFSPSMIVWMSEQSDSWLSFEVENGNFCAYIPNRLTKPEELDQLCEMAAHVAERLMGGAH